MCLPPLRAPNVGVVLMPSFGQSVESVVGALRRALGRWPHHEAKIAGDLGYIGVLYIATPRCSHDTGRRCSTCSKIHFVSGEGKVPAGFHVDWIHADEPPPEEHWRELRMRSRANAPLYSWISATPLDPRAYRWLQRDFEGCFGTPRDGKVELAWSLEDNRFLSEAYKRKQIERAKKDPYFRARIFGEYVDVRNLCPFSLGGLQRWLARAETPRPAAVVEVVRDGDPMLVLKPHPRGQIEVFAEPEPDEHYICVADPSSGIRDTAKSDADQPRNPAGLNVVGMRSRRHALRFNGYVSATDLGRMARVICDTYNGALFVPEMNGGWGETTLTAFGFDYSNVYVDVRVSDRTASRARKVGWYQTHSKRGLLIGALQRAVDEDGMDVRSAAAIQNLMAVTTNDDDKIVQGDGRGAHGEDMVTLGVAAYLLEVLPIPGPAATPEAESPAAAFIAALRKSEGPSSPDNYGGRWR